MNDPGEILFQVRKSEFWAFTITKIDFISTKLNWINKLEIKKMQKNMWRLKAVTQHDN